MYILDESDKNTAAPDVDKLPKLSLPVVAVELGKLLREPALELGTRLVLRCVPWEELSINFIPADKLTRGEDVALGFGEV